MENKKIGLEWTTVVHNLTTDLWIPVTEWDDAGGLGNCRAWIELRGRFGTALVVPAYQTACDKRQPDAPLPIPIAGGAAGYANVEGVFDPATPLTTLAMADKLSVRYGFLIKLASGTIGGARVRGGIQVLF